jgi:hypothetical protein
MVLKKKRQGGGGGDKKKRLFFSISQFCMSKGIELTPDTRGLVERLISDHILCYNDFAAIWLNIFAID